MLNLMELTASQVINYLVDEQAAARGISKSLAKKLVLNALTYNVVTAEIDNQIDYLLEGEE